ncbi:MAG: hypothetical protein HY000_28000 [Planctomycetes bacterium]|nr:hypothetical protein [Planctomycetota bacterium]
MSSTAEAPSEMDILRRIVEQDQEPFSVDTAQALLRLGFGEADRVRIDELAARNRKGELSPIEEEELSNYVRVGQMLGILQSKARRSLKEAHRSKDNAG